MSLVSGLVMESGMLNVDVDAAAAELLRIADDALEDEDGAGQYADADADAEGLTVSSADSSLTSIASLDDGLHRVRIGIQEHQADQDDDLIHYVSVGVACIDTITSDVHVLLTDAFTVSDVQYGHYDIGNPFDIYRERWDPDQSFSQIVQAQKSSRLKALLLSIAQGRSDHTLVPLPVKPDYADTLMPLVGGDLASKESIASSMFFINKTAQRSTSIH